MADGRIVQKKPFVIEEQGDKVAWCACGRSANQPYCDRSHRGTEFRPIVVEVQPGQKVAWCGCKHSGNKPFCDGTHRTL
jgi:CDGSH-type Zn-finger protein